MRKKLRPVSNINVTPMVDVMLVLLIVFMVTAPLLTVGVPVNLPKVEANSLDAQKEPLEISINEENNINGSINNIAGIFNDKGNVLGMMPHPERAIDVSLGGEDGIIFFKTFFEKLG